MIGLKILHFLEGQESRCQEATRCCLLCSERSSIAVMYCEERTRCAGRPVLSRRVSAMSAASASDRHTWCSRLSSSESGRPRCWSPPATRLNRRRFRGTRATGIYTAWGASSAARLRTIGFLSLSPSTSAPCELEVQHAFPMSRLYRPLPLRQPQDIEDSVLKIRKLKKNKIKYRENFVRYDLCL
jgi:hypothetical protein